MTWSNNCVVAIERLRTLAVKNQIGPPWSPSSCAVIGRVCASSTLAIRSIIVMSDFNAFQNFASNSAGLVNAISRTFAHQRPAIVENCQFVAEHPL